MIAAPVAIPAYSEIVSAYRNTAEHNDALHRQLTKAALSSPLLAGHRRHVERNRLGFGDTAFHAMWNLLLREASQHFGNVQALEIGVYKGQIISLWNLIAAAERLNVAVSAITPLQGNAAPSSAIWRRLRRLFDRRFREQLLNGNFYPECDYDAEVRGLFRSFELDFDRVRLYRGYSNDAGILQSQADQRYHLIYVDGDHTYEGALADFRNFAPKVAPGGWLIADDAGCDLPGTVFWKGHDAVTRAAAVLLELGFRNVFNVGHNRVFQKVD